jgi:hypothetical protein
VGRGAAGPPPDPEVFALAMLPLAAKYVARSDQATASAMTAMLGAAAGVEPLAALKGVLSGIRGHAEPRHLVGRYLQVVEALHAAK